MTIIRRSVLSRFMMHLLVLLFVPACNSMFPAQPQRPQREEASQETIAVDVKRLVDQLISPKPRERAAAAVALGKLKADAKDAIPILIKMLRDDAVLPGGEFDTGVGDSRSDLPYDIQSVVRDLALLVEEVGLLGTLSFCGNCVWSESLVRPGNRPGD